VIGGRTLVGTSYRKIGKTINYQCLYGGGVQLLARKLGVKEKEAQMLLDLYYKTFATAIAWLDTQKSHLDVARRNGEDRVFAETRSGWKRWLDIPRTPIHPAKGGQVSVEAMQQYEEDKKTWRKANGNVRRQLANTPIQGLSAAITKEAAAYWYEEVGYMDDMRLVAIIHDEFIVEVKDPDKVMFDGQTHAEYAGRLLEGCMMDAMGKYLHVVDLGTVHAVQTPFWEH